jgi:hypothetical protein
MQNTIMLIVLSNTSFLEKYYIEEVYEIIILIQTIPDYFYVFFKNFL